MLEIAINEFILFFFEIVSHCLGWCPFCYVAKDDLNLLILLPLAQTWLEKNL